MTDAAWTPTELVTVMAARHLANTSVVFAGIGLPSSAAILAQQRLAPGLFLVFESGALGARPASLPRSVADEEIARTARTIVSIPEIFAYWLAPGRIELGILGAAQVDRYGNINSTVIGPYANPHVRLPGAGGAPEIASGCQATMILLLHDRRAFVDRLDFVTTIGHGDGPGDRARLGLRGGGPAAVVTDLGVLQPDPDTSELTLTSLHAGATVERVRAATGWDVAVRDDLTVEPEPSADELATLRRLERSS